MRTRIVKIGNSLCVRIPKALPEQSRLAEEVEIKPFDRQNRHSFRTRTARRLGAAFQAMAQNGDDRLLDADEQIQTSSLPKSFDVVGYR